MKVLTEKDRKPQLPEKEGYVAVERTVGAVALNLWGAAIGLPLMALAIVAHVAIWKDEIFDALTSNPLTLLYGIIWLLVGGCALMFAYELCHGIAWCLMSGLPLNRMRLGFAGGGLLFQCRIDGELLPKRTYVRGLIIPDLILGLLTLALGLCLNSMVATILGALVLLCTVSDIVVVHTIRDEAGDTPVYIHPKQAGVYAYHRE